MHVFYVSNLMIVITVITFVCVVGDRRGQEHSGEEVYSNSVRVFDTGWYFFHDEVFAVWSL